MMKLRIIHLITAPISAALLTAPSAFALAYHWDANGDETGTGGAGTWNTSAALWAAGAPGGTLSSWPNSEPNGDSARFGGTLGTGVVALNSDSVDLNVNNITFITSGYTISGPSGGTAKLKLSGLSPAIDTESVSATISAGIIGSSGLIKSGSGTLTLTGPNAYTGKTVINAGTVSIGDIANVGAATSSLGAPADDDSGTIDLNGTLIYTGGAGSSDRIVNLTGTGTIRNNGSGTLTLSGRLTGNDRKIVFRGSGNITHTGVVATGGGQLFRTEYGTLTLTNAANSFSGTVTIAQGTVSVNSISNGGTPSALGQGNAIVLGQTGNPGGGKLRFTGAGGGSSDRSITIVSNFVNDGGTIENTVAGQKLKLNGAVGVGSGSAASTILHIAGAGDGEFSGEVSGDGLGITKGGGGTWTLSGANSYTGTTTVYGGTLALNGSSIADGNKLVIYGPADGKITDNGRVSVAGSETVNRLFFGTVQQAMGTWGSSDSSATHVDDTRFSGTGVVNVTTGAVIAYGSWVNRFGLAEIDQDPNADPDGDGVTNLAEYALGGDPARNDAALILPSIKKVGSNYVFTFTRSDLSEQDTSQAVEFSDDLTVWKSHAIGASPGASPVTILENTPNTELDTVTITFPATDQSRLFVRLRISQ